MSERKEVDQTILKSCRLDLINNNSLDDPSVCDFVAIWVEFIQANFS